MWTWRELKRIFKREMDTRKLGAIMWPAVYPVMGNSAYQPRDPHCTIIYFGEIDGNIGFTKEDVIDVIKATDWNTFILAHVSGLEWFGAEQDVPVLTLHHSYLQQYYEQVKAELVKRGIPFDTTFPDYKPHVTITDAAALSRQHPLSIMLGPVELWWGGEHISIEDKVVDQRLD